MATTENMGMDIPVVSSTIGPDWASKINEALQLIDAHNHASGSGAKVTPSGILINAALDMLGYKLNNIASAGLSSKSSSDTTHTGSIQNVGGNLYFITNSGTAVQLTSGTSIVSPGSGALSLAAPGAYPYTVTTGDNASIQAIDCSSARTINLPAATNSMYVYLKDSTGEAQTNAITVTPNGSDLIDGANSNYTIDWNWAQVGFISDGVSKWYVI